MTINPLSPNSDESEHYFSLHYKYLFRLHVMRRGTLGGTQNRNTAKKISKTAIPHRKLMEYQNRIRKCQVILYHKLHLVILFIITPEELLLVASRVGVQILGKLTLFY